MTAVVVTEVDSRPVAVTASNDDTARVWDLVNATERATLSGHTGSVTAVVVTEIDSRPVTVTASRDNTVRIWDLIAKS